MFAKEDYEEAAPPLSSCYGCGKPILDRFLLTVLDKNWHVSCVRCHQCGHLLDNKCFFREGKIFCREDFYRLYGPRCGGCLEGIAPTDLVRKARDKPFHLACFTCAICRKQLSTGEELFVIDRDRFICKDDFNNIRSQDYCYSDEEEDCGDEKLLCSPPPLPPLSSSLPPLSSPISKLVEANNNNNSLEATSNTIITKIKTEEGEFPDLECGDVGEDRHEQENRSPDGEAGKRRGPRTTIKAKQLEVLKTAFNQTPKPTRHIREQLAKETGLSMRVIQVWFQNKRSKERRMKQLTSGMLPRGFFGGHFGDFGFGPRFPGHPDFFPGGPMQFLGPHHGLPPSMEQPLPMTGCPLPPDQFPVPSHMSEKSLLDLPYNMSTKGGGLMDMGSPSFPMSVKEGFGLPMDLHRTDFNSPGCDSQDVSDQMTW